MRIQVSLEVNFFSMTRVPGVNRSRRRFRDTLWICGQIAKVKEDASLNEEGRYARETSVAIMGEDE